MKTRRTVTFGSRSYTIARLTDEQGHAIFGPDFKFFSWASQLVLACLNNVDGGSRTLSELVFTGNEWDEFISACLELNGLRKKKTNESSQQDSAAVPNPRLFGMGGRVFYLRRLSAIECERLQVVVMVIGQTPKTHLSAEHAFELADIFAGAAGMTRTELFRSVKDVDTWGLLDALRQVSRFPTSDGITYFGIGVSSA
jgi:hypothetical protein